MIRAVVSGVDNDGVVGELEVIDALEQLADVAVVFKHAIGIFVAWHTALALHGITYMCESMHASGVHPHKEWFVSLGLFLNEIDGGLSGLVIDCFHAFAVQCTGVFDLAIGVAVDHSAWRCSFDKCSVVFWPVRALWFLFGVEVIQVAEELVEAVVGWEVFVLVP
ncbi:hypothetical protein D3C80_1250000 [compost metagenome]